MRSTRTAMMVNHLEVLYHLSFNQWLRMFVMNSNFMFLWIFPGQINRCAKNRRMMHFNDLECQWTKNGRYPWVSLFYSWLEPSIWLLVCILNSDWKEYQKISTAPALVLMLEKVRPWFVQGTLPITYSWSSCLSNMFSPLLFFSSVWAIANDVFFRTIWIIKSFGEASVKKCFKELKSTSSGYLWSKKTYQ